MPGWQRFYEARPSGDFEIVSIATEHLGAEAARPYVERAGATFPTLVDEGMATARAFGFKVVPNGVLVDGEGTIRYAKYGGFSVENPEDVDAVTRFARGGDPGPAADPELPYTLSPGDQDRVQTLVRQGRDALAQGRAAEAVARWREALRIDPLNFVVRKQIWAAEHPERFHPAIDGDWQKETLARERQEEVEQGICGPDGCPLPR